MSKFSNMSVFEAMIQKKIVQRSCKGPVSVKRVDPKGDYIVIENTCIKKVNICTMFYLGARVYAQILRVLSRLCSQIGRWNEEASMFRPIRSNSKNTLCFIRINPLKWVFFKNFVYFEFKKYYSPSIFD